jgi:hypothetical protein
MSGFGFLRGNMNFHYSDKAESLAIENRMCGGTETRHGSSSGSQLHRMASSCATLLHDQGHCWTLHEMTF